MFVAKGVSPTEPEGVSDCLNGDLTLPLIDESHSPVAEKCVRFSTEAIQLISEEMRTLLEGGVILHAEFSRAAQMARIRAKNGRLRPYDNKQEFNSFLILYSGGLGGMPSIRDGFKGRDHFAKNRVGARRPHQIPIAEADRRKTASRDADDRPFALDLAGFDLMVSPPPEY